METKRKSMHKLKYYFLFLIAIITFFVFCLSIKPNIKDKPQSANLDASLSDSNKLELTCGDFIDALAKGKNLLKMSECTQTTTTGMNKNKAYFIETTFKVNQYNLKYAVFSKEKIKQPYLLDYSLESYLYSTIEIKNKVFSLDSIDIEPHGSFPNRKMNVPLTLCNLLMCGTFNFLDQEYIVIQGYPPCNGRTCIESYLILINVKTSQLKLLVFNEYHPFYTQNIFFGDIDNDNFLDYYLVNETVQNENYNVRTFSLKDMLLPFHSSACTVDYSCEKCSGEMTDTLVILRDDCAIFK